MLLKDAIERVRDELGYWPGAMFYSGRSALAHPSEFYFLGFNPHGYKDEPDLKKEVDEWLVNPSMEVHSAFDRGWKEDGSCTLYQIAVRHLFQTLGLTNSNVPSSNLIFMSAPSEQDLMRLAEERLGLSWWALAEKCWAVHENVIATVRPKYILCLGNKTNEFVAGKLGAKKPYNHIGIYKQSGTDRRLAWATSGSRDEGEPVVFGLAHPSRKGGWVPARNSPVEWVKGVVDATNYWSK
ncbi:MAG: hypothetical protein ACR2F8_08815 [Caulobacteraceae bacterium]